MMIKNLILIKRDSPSFIEEYKTEFDFNFWFESCAHRRQFIDNIVRSDTKVICLFVQTDWPMCEHSIKHKYV